MALERSTDALDPLDSTLWHVFRVAFVPPRWHSAVVQITNGSVSSDRRGRSTRTNPSFHRPLQRGGHVHRQCIGLDSCDKESYEADRETPAIETILYSNETKPGSLTLISQDRDKIFP